MILKTLASYIRKLKDKSGNYVLPAVRAKGVYLDDNTTLQSWMDNLLKTIYPVGAIYQSMNATSPASLFGGSWTPINGVFLLSNSNSYQVNTTGGEANVTLSVNTIPSHNHGNSINGGSALIMDMNSGGSETTAGFLFDFDNQYPNWYRLWDGTPKGRVGLTGYTGGGQAHNNMPPYLVCCMWRRVS